jgi:hypothetical protein
MKTKKLKNFIKKNYSKEFVFRAYEFYADPPSYFLERLYTQDYDYVLDVFIEECNNVSILDAINYYIKNKKEKYECR